MHNAELAVSTQIIEVAKQVENLENKKITKSGIVPQLKNWLLSLRVEIKNLQLNSKYDKYVQKIHLIEVSCKYKEAADRIINPHMGWYNYSIPELSLNIIKSELIPIQEINSNFSINEETFAQLVKDKRLSVHTIGNQNVVSRRELLQFRVA